jgi:hypothetical protein
MTRKENEIKNKRQPYQKPQLEQVRLLVDEAVLTACKNPTSPGKNETAGCRAGTNSCKAIWTGT